MICDGRHLHPHTVDFLVKTIWPERLILVNDSLMATGLGYEVYEYDDGESGVPD